MHVVNGVAAAVSFFSFFFDQTRPYQWPTRCVLICYQMYPRFAIQVRFGGINRKVVWYHATSSSWKRLVLARKDTVYMLVFVTIHTVFRLSLFHDVQSDKWLMTGHRILWIKTENVSWNLNIIWQTNVFFVNFIFSSRTCTCSLKQKHFILNTLIII